MPAMLVMLMLFAGVPALGAVQDKQTSGPDRTADLNRSDITTTWNLSFLFKDRDEATAKYEELRNRSQAMNATFRPLFANLTGGTLLAYLEESRDFSKNLSLLYAYASAQNNLNVNDQAFESLLSDAQNLYTENYKDTSFADVTLKSLSAQDWERIYAEEPGLELFRAYLLDNFGRYADHRPRNESHAAYLADISNQLMKIDTDAGKRVTNNVTMAGNITLEDGRTLSLNSQTYTELVTTDKSRVNRKTAFDKRFYHLINESDAMAGIYSNKSELDDLLARELNFRDAYESKMFEAYLSEEQVQAMNDVFKERKGDFDGYYEYRRQKMNLDRLKPYDLNLQLLDRPDVKYDYIDTLFNISASYAKMDPAFREIFNLTVSSGSIDVYPNPEGGKSPGGFCQDMFALQRPSLIFMNYKGLMDDQRTITHEMGHAINFYLMGANVDYLYCDGTEYEMEIPSTFNEELFMDYALANYDHDTALALLADTIGDYENYFTFQPMITEFEKNAHVLCRREGGASGSDLNALWTNLSKEYRSSLVDYYPEDSAQWTYISHIYFTNNYYTFSYALSKAVSLSLFKMYKEDPESFNKNYIAYLSAGTSMTPPEKLRRFFGLEIDRKLFEDAMDVVALRVQQLQQLQSEGTGKSL
ncbi:MAG TPA: M3 family metallopeptidase [Methanothrix sp.]|nr:M3 family metallopeptidase [Methanothrix sp.]HPT19714.1 M3 family metallopeptidase [Methanothrix sp.]